MKKDQDELDSFEMQDRGEYDNEFPDDRNKLFYANNPNDPDYNFNPYNNLSEISEKDPQRITHEGEPYSPYFDNTTHKHSFDDDPYLDSTNKPLLFEKSKKTPRKSFVEKKFDEFWKIVLEAEIPDEKEAMKFAKRNNINYLKTIHYSRILIMNNIFVLFMALLVIYTLVMLNFKFLCCSNAADIVFDIFTIMVMICFIAEFTLYMVADVEYFNSFYFYADIMSIVLLFFDISGVRESFFEITSDPEKIASYRIFDILGVMALIRVLKLMRYTFQKKYKTKRQYYQEKLKLDQKIVDTMLLPNTEIHRIARVNSTNSQISSRKSYRPPINRTRKSISVQRNRQLTNIVNDRRSTLGVQTKKQDQMYFVLNTSQLKESKLSRRMLYLTNKRLMMLLLLMLIFVPIFSVEFWRSRDLAYENDLVYLTRLYANKDKDVADVYFNSNLLVSYKDAKTEVINLDLPKFKSYVVDSSGLRNEEIRQYAERISYSYQGTGNSVIEYSEVGIIRVSYRRFVQIQALLNIIRVALICLIFYWGMLQFKQEARRQILNPLEGILNKISLVSKNPMRALEIGKQYKQHYNSDISLIETTIQKIAYLLVLGFGAAGNDLLANALKSSAFDMENISQAKTVYGIFGFCDIRRFTDATEVLLGEIMVFVNTIGKIVHEEVARCKGGANKNIGDAFLVFWKLKNKDVSDVEALTNFDLTEEHRERIFNKYKNFETNDYIDSNNTFNNLNEENEQLMKRFYFNNLQNSKMAELSLISFLRIIARIETDAPIRKYNKYKKLKKAMPDFYVHLGFGLHAGWAIEGAIGSVLKIDMTYLSPHVNMSARLEGLTKSYGVPLLFTNSLYNLFTTTGIKKLCRKLDRVVVKNTDEPFELYTIDLSIDNLKYYNSQPTKTPNINALQSFKNIRIDFMSNAYLRKEKAKEENMIVSQYGIGMINENEYLEYNEIERMFETIIMDNKLVLLLNLNAPKEQRRNFELFLHNYHNALEEFLEGHWGAAKGLFEKLIYHHPDDKSSKLIYDYMADFEFLTPRNWNYARPIKD